MEILSYLAELIKTRKEVGIPGLGTIYKIKSPGRYDVGSHAFVPPTYTLDFTDEIKEHTSLATFISRKRNISSESAAHYIDQFAASALQQLADHQEVDLGEIGTLSHVSDKVSFTPGNAVNLGTDFYGLPNLKEDHAASSETTELTSNEPVSSEKTEELYHEKKEIEEEFPVYEEISEVPLPDQPVIKHYLVETPEVAEDILPTTLHSSSLHPEPIAAPTPSAEPVVYEEEEEKQAPFYPKVIIALAIVLLAVAAIYFLRPDLFSRTEVPAQPTIAKTVIPDSSKLKADSIAQVDSIKRSNEKVILAIDSAKDTAKTATPMVPTAVETPAAPLRFEIIAASLANKKEADEFLAQMKRRNIPAKVADLPGRRIKISIGSFNDEQAAKDELKVLKKTTKIPGIYIFPVRHTQKPK